MIKKLFANSWVFMALLKFFSFFAKRNYFDWLTKWLTTAITKLNVWANGPFVCNTPLELAQAWKKMMPDNKPCVWFEINTEGSTNDLVLAKIHLDCPLRHYNDGRVACEKLMNYDKKLMEKIGGSLKVIQSQSDPEYTCCILEITKDKPK